MSLYQKPSGPDLARFGPPNNHTASRQSGQEQVEQRGTQQLVSVTAYISKGLFHLRNADNKRLGRKSEDIYPMNGATGEERVRVNEILMRDPFADPGRDHFVFASLNGLRRGGFAFAGIAMSEGAYMDGPKPTVNLIVSGTVRLLNTYPGVITAGDRLYLTSPILRRRNDTSGMFITDHQSGDDFRIRPGIVPYKTHPMENFNESFLQWSLGSRTMSQETQRICRVVETIMEFAIDEDNNVAARIDALVREVEDESPVPFSSEKLRAVLMTVYSTRFAAQNTGFGRETPRIQIKQDDIEDYTRMVALGRMIVKDFYLRAVIEDFNRRYVGVALTTAKESEIVDVFYGPN